MDMKFSPEARTELERTILTGADSPHLERSNGRLAVKFDEMRFVVKGGGYVEVQLAHSGTVLLARAFQGIGPGDTVSCRDIEGVVGVRISME